MQKKYIFLVLLLLSTGCQKYYISICQAKLDKDYLASSHVATPDFRQKSPPLGDQLIIEWKVSEEFLRETPLLYLHVIYKDYTEAFFSYPMSYRMGYVVYSLLGEEYKEKKGLLTYKAEIRTEKGGIFRDWKHQLWTNLLVIKEEPIPSVMQIEEEEEPRWNEDSFWQEFPSSYPDEKEKQEEEDNVLSAANTSFSVISQSRQESVTERNGLR